MTEEERIYALHDQGRITDAQAQRLISALRGITDTENTLIDIDQALDASLDEVDQTFNNLGEGVEPNGSDPIQENALSTDELVQRWVHIQTSVTNLTVEQDPNINEPTLSTRQGDLALRATEDGWLIEQPGAAEKSILDRFVAGIQRSKANLKIPAGVGLHAEINFGDIDTYNVPAIKGRIHAGDLDIHGAQAVNLRVNAGDVEIEIDPTPGEHRIDVSVGELNLTLPEHANVNLEGRVSVGDVSTRPPFEERGSGGLSKRVEGTHGKPDARLRASVGTGELSIRIQGERRGG